MGNHLKNILTGATIMIAVLWAVELLDWLLFWWNLDSFGIRPRQLKGLPGIILSPLLHAGVWHLLSNTIPLFILTVVLFMFYDRIGVQTLLVIVVVGGGLVWLLGRSAYHVGASGVIYGIAAFLVASGFFRRDFKSIVIAAVVVLVYGGLFWGLFPTQFRISWEAHLFGALAGVFAAYIFRNAELNPQTATEMDE